MKDKNGKVKYNQTGGGYRLEYGGFTKYGTGWYILTAEGTGAISWQLKNPDPCPPFANWEGYETSVTCI